ncbi:hypothetical protein MMC17_001987 [Xylographa soralifera]|nr:hypothetical protein [Xylographa soralifera]
MDAEGNTHIVAETDLLADEKDDSPPDAGNPSTPHAQASHVEDEADKHRSLPPTKRDPYKIEVTPIHDRKRGYPQLAAFAGCDPNFAIYRQFKHIRHRCLLYMQDELRELEHDLQQMDLIDILSNEKLLFSRSRDAREGPLRRMELIAQIKDKIYEYDKMLRSTRDLMQWQPPTERNRRSYVDYIMNEQPTVEVERIFIRRSDDLVTLAGDLQDRWLNGRFERLLSKMCPRLTTALLLTNNKEIKLFDKARFDIFVRFVMTCIITVLLMASPLTIPLVQQAGYEREEVVLPLTGVFAILVAVFASPTRGELFAAAVAYYVVLVLSLHSALLCNADET